ncbi:MAG: hypothetical protein HY074_15690 [Deltaproteobacteria bacterium]|nr:hypothetical protein [Deltaproteobacteria bacterium]
MKNPIWLICMIALSLGTGQARADETGTDCVPPPSFSLPNLNLFGTRLLMLRLRETPQGPYAGQYAMTPVWVETAPIVGQSGLSSFRVHKIAHVDFPAAEVDKTALGEANSAAAGPFYVVEIGKSDTAAASIIASGQKNGNSAEGKIAFGGVVEIFGKAVSEGGAFMTRSGADFQFARVALGSSGVTLVALSRTAFHVVSTPLGASGAVQPAGGVTLEIPTGSGVAHNTLRVGIIAGPVINNKGATPSLSGGAQLLFF